MADISGAIQASSGIFSMIAVVGSILFIGLIIVVVAWMFKEFT